MEWSFGGDAGVLSRKIQFSVNRSRKYAFFGVFSYLVHILVLPSHVLLCNYSDPVAINESKPKFCGI